MIQSDTEDGSISDTHRRPIRTQFGVVLMVGSGGLWFSLFAIPFLPLTVWQKTVLGVAVWIKWNDKGVEDARIVLGAVASYPQVIEEAASSIIGTSLDDESIEAAARASFKPSKPMDNTDFGLAWRKQMTLTYVRGALRELRDRNI